MITVSKKIMALEDAQSSMVIEVTGIEVTGTLTDINTIHKL